MRATEMHFHRLADSVAQLVWVVDAAGRISYGNSSWYAHTGIGAGANFVRNYLPLLHPEDRSGWERTWGHALARSVSRGEWRCDRLTHVPGPWSDLTLSGPKALQRTQPLRNRK